MNGHRLTVNEKRARASRETKKYKKRFCEKEIRR